MGLRSSINHNLTEIVQLHEEILGDLHRVVPHSEYSQLELRSTTQSGAAHGHGRRHIRRRCRSLDTVPENRRGLALLQNIPGMVSDPQVAAEVAKVFGKKVLA